MAGRKTERRRRALETGLERRKSVSKTHILKAGRVLAGGVRPARACVGRDKAVRKAHVPECLFLAPAGRGCRAEQRRNDQRRISSNRSS
jgi:hypothetical protein